jgi:hypothetical protein
MRLSENEICALKINHLFPRANAPQQPPEGAGMLKGSVSRIITSLQDIGLAERAAGAILLARTTPAEAFKRLYNW